MSVAPARCKAPRCAAQSATDVADLQQLLPQLQAAEASVSAALQDMAEGREGSAPLAPAASAAPSPCQEQAKAHGKRVIIPALQVSEDLLPPTQQRAAALRGQARGLAKLLPGLHASQRLARELRESIGQVQEESQPVVHRIKQLHKQQVAAEDTLERVQDLADLRAGLAELEAAMRQGQTQSAAVSIKQLRALQQRLPMHSSDLCVPRVRKCLQRGSSPPAPLSAGKPSLALKLRCWRQCSANSTMPSLPAAPAKSSACTSS